MELLFRILFNNLPRIHHHSVLSDAAKKLGRTNPVPDIETLSSPTAAATLNSSIEAEESDDDNSILSVVSSEGDAEIDAKFQQGLTHKKHLSMKMAIVNKGRSYQVIESP